MSEVSAIEPNPDWLSFLPRNGRIHFIGIGGVGMAAIARVLVEAGLDVSGSDLKSSAQAQDLQRRGVRFTVGHRAEQVEGASLVVVSSAVPGENPEIHRARELGLPIIKRAELLGNMTRHRQSVAIAGTHGKTTTTAMLGLALVAAGLDPTVLVGGTVPAIGGGGRFGRGQILVTEADEFDGSFLRFWPWVAVVTSVEPDHLDYYRDFEAIVAAFRAFAARLPIDGVLVVCGDNPQARQLLSATTSSVLTYGLLDGLDWQATGLRRSSTGWTEFRAVRRGRDYGRYELAVPGRHNVANALAAIAVADLCGADPALIRAALADFRGVNRRFELKGTAMGVSVYDDYAHHPTEIKATLRAAREQHPGRIVCLFQPHTVNRTQNLFTEFTRAFGDANVALVTDIYVPAGRERIEQGLTAGDLVRAMSHPRAEYVGDLEQALERLVGELREGDLLVTMGAGDVDWVADQVVAHLANASGARDDCH